MLPAEQSPATQVSLKDQGAEEGQKLWEGARDTVSSGLCENCK